ncbi:cytochrome b [Photobacterium atrarenae]|uniref:cytochrome b n=1 Tax=Photobacterium atrarenae TaxID=865757 RepID=UPI0034E29F43
MLPKQTYIIDRVLHWVSSLTILFLLLDMGTRTHLIDYRIKGAIAHKQDAIELHMIMGLFLFVVLLMRLIWTRFFLHPEYQVQYQSRKHKWLVLTIHNSMYMTLLLLMCSGLFMVSNYEHPLNILGVFQFSDSGVNQSIFLSANNWHLWFESLIYFLIFIHFSGAVYNRR